MSTPQWFAEFERQEALRQERIDNIKGEQERRTSKKYVDIVFDGPPGPEAGRFVEVENSLGQSIRFGEWVHRPDGYWVLRIDR